MKDQSTAIVDSLWAAEPVRLKQYLDTIGNATADQVRTANDLFKAQEPADLFTIEDDEAIIEITGFLSPNGPSPIDKLFGFGGTGFKQLQAAIAEIQEMEEIKTVRLLMDTPGGTVTGTDETYQALANLALAKNVIAENYGMIASGGYWLAVAANTITAMAPTGEQGSIGVIYATYDFSKMLDNAGIKQVVIVSKNAPRKDSRVSIKTGIEEIQRRLDALEGIFLARVARGRNTTVARVKRDFGQGGVLVAQDPKPNMPDALSVGMIDSVNAPVSGNQISNNKSTKSTESGRKSIMKLTDLLAEHPEAKVEFDAALSDKFKVGEKAAQDAIEARVNVAKPILASDVYPDPIHQLAIKVIAGETEASALEASVATFDAIQEKAASDKAADDTDTTGDSPATSGAGASDDGIIRDDGDVAKEAARVSGQDIMPGKGGS